tara:strand:+ start:141 stop:386 length:246 start_codon:yes stop_codon:yes gene_type:complete
MKMEIKNLVLELEKLKNGYELKSQDRRNSNDIISDAKMIAEQTSDITNKVLKISLQMENLKNSLNKDEKRELKQLGLLDDV